MNATGSAPAGAKTVLTVQYLRGIAATFVVIDHLQTNRLGAFLHGITDWGAWGVDIFFVISGFVMWRASMAGGVRPLSFMIDRVTRIYPLYWLALTIWIVARLVVPDSLANADLTGPAIVRSYLLLPGFHPVYKDFAWPILTQGWTLQLELLFYAIVALSLRLSSPGARAMAVFATLGALVTFGHLFHPKTAIGLVYSSNLLSEFALGMLLAMAYPRIQQVPVALGPVLVMAGLLSEFTDIPGRIGVLPEGFVAAGLVVAGALVSERLARARPVPVLHALGDASYSMYLFHTIAISATAVVLSRIPLLGDGSVRSLIFSVAALVASLAGSLLLYRWCELPLLRASRSLVRGLARRPTEPATGPA